MTISARDCCAFDPQPDPDEAHWLRLLYDATRAESCVVHLGEHGADDPVVYCEPDGTWFAGRYIGTIVFAGQRLEIRPRFGAATIRAWLAGAFNIALVETEGELNVDDWFIPWLLGTFWARAFVSAARHGLPSLHAETHERGYTIRGGIDIPATIRARTGAERAVVSRRREKSLTNDISRALIAAYSELSRAIGPAREKEWLPERVRDLIPHLVQAVGSNPTIPSASEIARVRLTPITMGFRPLAELSLRIAHRRGLTTDLSPNRRCRGVLLDVAELWELYVLAALRKAWPGHDVRHGTRQSSGSDSLLVNERGAKMGQLKPDAMVESRGHIVAILDAKYKRLEPSSYSPWGPQREDLYQLAAYLSRFGANGQPIVGGLVYPTEQTDGALPFAEAGNPWQVDQGRVVRFLTLPHDVNQAAAKVRETFPLHR